MSHVGQPATLPIRVFDPHRVGLDGANPTVITNPPLMAVPQPVRQGKSTQVAYRGPWEASFSGRNAFITEFAYEG